MVKEKPVALRATKTQALDDLIMGVRYTHIYLSGPLTEVSDGAPRQTVVASSLSGASNDSTTLTSCIFSATSFPSSNGELPSLTGDTG